MKATALGRAPPRFAEEAIGRHDRALSNKGALAAWQNSDHPTFRPAEDKVGTGWHVDVVFEDEVPVQVPGFRSEAEAQDWIDHKSGAWLKARGTKKKGRERELLEEALRLMRYVAGAPGDPKSPIVAMHIFNHLREIGSVRPPNVTKKTLAARKRLAEDADLLTEVIKHSPKYSNIEFKCLDDYDKCRRHRGRYNLLCILSYIVCIGRRIIPLVPHT